MFRRQNDLAPPDRLFQRSLVLVTSYIRGHAFFYGATPGFFQRRQLGHGFILIIKERQHVADNGRGCCHVAAMFKYAGRRIARIVCWRETLKQGMITKFEGQCCIAPDTAERKSVVSGTSVSVRVGLGGRRILTKKSTTKTQPHNTQ